MLPGFTVFDCLFEIFKVEINIIPNFLKSHKLDEVNYLNIELNKIACIDSTRGRVYGKYSWTGRR